MFEHESVVALAIDAGHAILEVYNKDTNIEVMTKDDDSPLTQRFVLASRSTRWYQGIREEEWNVHGQHSPDEEARRSVESHFRGSTRSGYNHHLVRG